ncbi:DUF4870 domain-containing protein [Polaribacter sp. IC073]|uniref:DUF4870 domain-containing protein n=1 Tax=Polaribacter sp. IC073 TaxID=2508540 RepID=UPI0011BD9551|nr:hypothetical protein [Polaribacter sp. IC073]TXD48281.1 hypothetical protein ES045_07555 [Polaribacter sp. IC073]
MDNYTVKEGKTAAIISHLWVLGLLIAFIMNNSKKNPFASFYIRQMVGLNLLYFANQYIVYSYIGATAGWIVGVVAFVLWIISLFGAIKGEEKLVPFIGEHFQEWFKNI